MRSRNSDKPKKPVDPEKVKVRLAGMCVRAEQCRHDIVEKLKKADIPVADKRAILAELIEGKFIDDSRYARSFARDKVRLAGWGRRKVSQALRLKRIADADISSALEEIEDDEYAEVLMKVARRKAASLDLAVYEDCAKLYRHLISRGFESNLITTVVKQLRAEQREEQ